VLFPAANRSEAALALDSDLMFPAASEFAPLAGAAEVVEPLWNGFHQCPPLLLLFLLPPLLLALPPAA
jgi:hypothetical protein